MKCGTCGAEIAEKAIVCYRCGAPTATPAIERRDAAPRSRRPLIAITVVVVIVVAVGIWMMLQTP